MRNSLILLLVLLVGGALLASTGPGAALMSRVGLPTWRDNNTVGQPQPGAGSTSVASNDENGSATAAPTPKSAEAPGTTSPVGESTAPATSAAAAPTKAPPPSPVPPTASPLEVAQAYMQNWQAGRYDQMYKLVSQASLRELGYDRKRFVERYSGIAEAATITGWAPKLRPEAEQAANRQELLLRLPYDVKIATKAVGEINETNLLPLVKENNTWRVQWSPSLIFKDLSGDLRVRLSPYPAARGNIFDRNGEALAIEGRIWQIGVVPGEIRNERQVLRKLSDALGMDEKVIQAKYKAGDPTYFWPIRDLYSQRKEELEREVGDLPGVTFNQRPGRTYPHGDVMAHVLGYVQQVSAEDLAKPEYANYGVADVIGRTGMERWGEKYLRGESGGKIWILDPATGAEVKTIGEKLARPGSDIYLNIDVNLQAQAEQDLGGRPGAIVALNPANGEILALVSQPSYDLNKFVVGISNEEWNRLNSKEANKPLVDRAAGSAFPPASTFKPITNSAALSARLPNLDRTWYSDGTWERLADTEGGIRRDWKPGGHGYVKLIDGITESIDTIYYDLGYELYLKCRDCLSDHARQWKLGSKLGVDGLAPGIEASGQVPGPGIPYPGWSPGDNVNLAIGQGALQASPLQMAVVYATIGNGGTIYRPNLINRVVAPDENGKIVKQWKPTVLGKAPASPQTIQFLQAGLRSVVESRKGTAYDVFKDAAFSSAGKTGTGQQDEADPYAWYVGYAPAVNPKIVVVGFGDRAGEGYKVAAPLVRRVMEQYLKPPAARP
ncbi:MAG: penicillin-binding transpeptidase domain-containing protein [Chloroflexota bacterium]|nr:penicillin-binding transpeptidase domain-containing protein [Chloroflexota bacterium]